MQIARLLHYLLDLLAMLTPSLRVHPAETMVDGLPRAASWRQVDVGHRYDSQSWCLSESNMTRRAGVSRRVIFRGQGEVGAKLKLDTDMRLAPFNLDLLKISSYEFSWEYE